MNLYRMCAAHLAHLKKTHLAMNYGLHKIWEIWSNMVTVRCTTTAFHGVRRHSLSRQHFSLLYYNRLPIQCGGNISWPEPHAFRLQQSSLFPVQAEGIFQLPALVYHEISWQFNGASFSRKVRTQLSLAWTLTCDLHAPAKLHHTNQLSVRIAKATWTRKRA